MHLEDAVATVVAEYAMEHSFDGKHVARGVDVPSTAHWELNGSRPLWRATIHHPRVVIAFPGELILRPESPPRRLEDFERIVRGAIELKIGRS